MKRSIKNATRKKTTKSVKAFVNKKRHVFLSVFVTICLFATFQNCGSSNVSDSTLGQNTTTGGGTGGAVQISPSTVALSLSATQDFNASGGTGTYYFSIYSGGGTINSSTGLFTAPSSASSGYVMVQDTNGSTAYASFSVSGSGGGGGGALQISPATVSLVASTTQTFAATGGTGSYTYSKISGTGSINASSGTYTAPATAGTAVVQVSDSAGSTSNANITITAATTTANKVPVYRFRYSNGRHFYTRTYSQGANAGYTSEGIGFYVYDAVNGSANLPLYRCLQGGVNHYISYNSNCEGNGANVGLLGYVFPSSASNTAGIYRLYKSANADHLYTLSASEFSSAIGLGYIFEWMMGYAPL